MVTVRNSTTKALYNLGVITISVGIIVSFIVAGAFGYTLDSYHFRMERNWAYTIGLFLGSLYSSVIMGILLIAISEILYSLEKICNNIARLGTSDEINAASNISSSNDNKSDYNLFAVAEGKSYENISSGSWVCQDCGNTNRSFENICSSCGAEKKRT